MAWHVQESRYYNAHQDMCLVGKRLQTGYISFSKQYGYCSGRTAHTSARVFHVLPAFEFENKEMWFNGYIKIKLDLDSNSVIHNF
jgi:hypothetical protein